MAKVNKVNIGLKRFMLLTLLLFMTLQGSAQQQRALTLEDCRNLALECNKGLKQNQENMAAAKELQNMAMAQMFPKISANGAYMLNQKNISLLNSNQQSMLNNLGGDALGIILPDLDQWISGISSISPTLGNKIQEMIDNSSLVTGLNGVGQNIVEATTFDVHNVWAAGITMTQPIFLGGKLYNLHQAAKAMANMSELQYTKAQEDLLLKVDEAYWQVISVQKKQQLAQEYCDLLDTMNQHVEALVEAEMATISDATQVLVKLNEAQMKLTKANTGLALSKMLLYQLCGLDMMGNYKIIEETNLGEYRSLDNINMDSVWAERGELKVLEQVDQIAASGVKIAASGLMPNIMAQGSYLVTNPNLFDGFQNKFGGMWNLGVVVNVPIAHPGDIYAVRAAKHKRQEVAYKIEEAKDMIELQVNKLNYELAVDNKRLAQAESNLQSAEDNLQLAEESFTNGMIASSDLMAAQTAWLSASSELLDAQIAVRMDYRYLNQALGGNQP